MEVDVDHACGHCVGLLHERTYRHDPGVVDQHVERAEALLDLVQEVGEAGPVGDVERQTDGPAAEFSAVCSASSDSMSPIATRAPWAISAAAVARPIPRAPPVIATTFPASERGALDTGTSS